jgi:transposase
MKLKKYFQALKPT